MFRISPVSRVVTFVEPPSKQQKTSSEVGNSGEPTSLAQTETEAPTDEKKPEQTETNKDTAASQPGTTKVESESSNATSDKEETGPTKEGASAQPPSSEPEAPVAAPAPAQPYQNVPAGLPPASGMTTPSDPNAIIEEKGTVSALFVGRVIGKGGGKHTFG